MYYIFCGWMRLAVCACLELDQWTRSTDVCRRTQPWTRLSSKPVCLPLFIPVSPTIFIFLYFFYFLASQDMTQTFCQQNYIIFNPRDNTEFLCNSGSRVVFYKAVSGVTSHGLDAVPPHPVALCPLWSLSFSQAEGNLDYVAPDVYHKVGFWAEGLRDILCSLGLICPDVLK